MITLVSTLHDPDGIYAPFLAQHAAVITPLYATKQIVATPETAAITIDQFTAHQFNVVLSGTREVGESRRRAVRLGMEASASIIHYCDADRLLYWAMYHLDELRTLLLTSLNNLTGYAAIGRTPSAFATHPPVQIETESITNQVCSWALGHHDVVRDVTAGSCAMSRSAASAILTHSIEPTNATDCEWPAIVQQIAHLPLTFIETEGLSFETAEFADYDAFSEAHSASNWQTRTRLTHHSINAVLRLTRT